MSDDALQTLDRYFQQVSGIILARQNPITGLLPASTAITAHGDYTDAWVRDNVYSILAAWGLGLAYRRVDDVRGRGALLDQSVVKLMRGLLVAMMKQSDKVEIFKYTLNPLDCLHAKYDTNSGDPVVGDDEWGHLQLDATSLFLLMLAQMTASGLRIIFTMDEVCFVQNLVHYIGRAYRTPDYGIWERGNKINHGIAEVNSSSVGMAKAALEAMDGFNCFGAEGGIDTVIRVVPDEVARARITLEASLPWESLSKEVDSATLSVIGYPAFAVENEAVVERTLEDVIAKLGGRYGCKRFLLDGHQASIEDKERLHYEPEEMGQFEHIECEWPLFFTYLLLHFLFTGDEDRAREYRDKLEGLLVEQDGQLLLPELYVVPKDCVEAERANPHTQDREANENVPLVWAQSLFILGSLIQDGLLDVADIDPLGRYRQIGRGLGKRIQLALISEDDRVREQLQEYGFSTQTQEDIRPITIHKASWLGEAFCHLGRSERLGLTGRPLRFPRGMATSCIYEQGAKLLVFQPQFLDRHDFYLSLDNQMLVRRLKMEMTYIYKQWHLPGRPLVVMVVTQRMLHEEGSMALIDFMHECQSGGADGVSVKLGTVKEFLPTSARESLHYLEGVPFDNPEDPVHDRPCCLLMPLDSRLESTITSENCEHSTNEELAQILTKNGNVRDQFTVVQTLYQRHHGAYETCLEDMEGLPCKLHALMEEVYIRARELSEWDTVRRAAAWLDKHDIDLEGAVTEIIVRKKALSVSRLYNKHSTFRQPVGAHEILSVIKEFNSDDMRAQILTQELVLNLGLLIRSRPELLSNMNVIRTGQLLQLIAGQVRNDQHCSANDALDMLMTMSPHHIADTLEAVLENHGGAEEDLYRSELMHFDYLENELKTPRFEEGMNPSLGTVADWKQWRVINGSIGRYPDSFYEGVWDVVNQTAGLVIGDPWNPKRRLDHGLCADMTRGEKLFRENVEHLFNKTPTAEDRRLYFEALMVLGAIMDANPGLRTTDSLYLDVLVGHAVRLNWLAAHQDINVSYQENRFQAWQSFYGLPPHEAATAFVHAFRYLLNEA